MVCFLPHPENICHWRSSVTIKNIIFSETFYCFELESRFTQKTPPGGWKLFINIFYSARDREIWIDLGNLLLPPHRSSTAVVYLYVCRASDIWIFVIQILYICISTHSASLCRGGQQTRDQPSPPQPALTSNQTSHFSASRDNVPSSDEIVHRHYLPLNTAQIAHLMFFFSTLIIGRLLELSTKCREIPQLFRER